MKKYRYRIDIYADDAPAKILRAVGRGKRVLEVGCASGVQSRFMKENLGCQVIGIDVDAAAADEARAFCESVLVGDLDREDFASELRDKRFDVIVFADVLEHLTAPGRALSTFKPLLSTDGYVLASIPNIVHAGVIMSMMHGRFDYHPYGLLDDTHVRFFTKKSIFALFESCGLCITELDRVKRPARDTEFYSHPFTEAENQLLAFLLEHNPEAETYQFIVKAIPAEPGDTRVSHSLLEAQERAMDLQITNVALGKRNRQLESQLSWIEGRWPYQALTRLRRLFK